MALRGVELANDPEDNPCFGCGPRNEAGLRLRFFDDGAVVRSELVPKPEHAGWPGMLNLGIALAAMQETGGWAVWERLGPSRIAGPFTFEAVAPLRLDQPLVLEARVTLQGERGRVHVQALAGGEVRGRMSWPVRKAQPEEARKLLELPIVPRSLRPDFEKLAGQSHAAAPAR
jgi:hypothetical protein